MELPQFYSSYFYKEIAFRKTIDVGISTYILEYYFVTKIYRLLQPIGIFNIKVHVDACNIILECMHAARKSPRVHHKIFYLEAEIVIRRAKNFEFSCFFLLKSYRCCL